MIEKRVLDYSKTLSDLSIAHEIKEHPEFREVSEVQAYLGLQLSDGFSTLVFIADDRPVAVIRRDDCSLDFEKVKQELHAKNVRKANDKEFEAITHMPVGAAPAYIPNVETLLDALLFEKKVLTGGSGSFLCSILYTSADLKKIPNSRVVSVAAMKAYEAPKNKRILSGITPSGDGTLHIGNYLGAVRQFIELCKTNETFLFVADMHGLTTIQDKKHLATNIENLILNELALLKGFLTKEEFDRIVFYRQSDVGMHGELQSILNNVTPLGLLKRAHAYKDKLAKDVMEDDINLGLFNYPILMAADILMYKPDFVPVGKDQKQHVEITRDIAERFNRIFKKKIFVLPEPHIPADVGSILGTDGKRKMSKSLGNIIAIFESEDVIKKQVNGTYTDPTRAHATDPGHVEGNMVFTYLDYFGNKEKVDRLKDEYRKGSVSDVAVKDYLFESLMTYFAPARKAYKELKDNPKMVGDILERGRLRATGIADQLMNDVREVVGLKTRHSLARPPLARQEVDVVSIDDFAKLSLQVGKVVEARNKEGSEKLIRLTVDVGETETRVIFTGVRGYGYTPEDFVGKQFFFITNLAPRKMLDEVSQGMILAVDGADKRPLFLSAEGMPIGSRIR